jgi:hypothetical protein
MSGWPIAPEHTEAFLKTLHPEPSARALVRFCARRSGKPWVVKWHYDPACRAILEILELAAQGWDVYVQVNPCATMAGGKINNVAYVHALVCDIDTLRTKTSYLKAIAFFDSKVGLRPSITVHSGNGGHLYFLLDRHYTVEEARATARRLCVAYWSDRVWNANRVLRLPGTTNTKEPPQPCYVHELTARRWSLDEINDCLDRICAPPASASDIDTPNTNPDDEFYRRGGAVDAIAQLPDDLRTAVETGNPPPGRVDMSQLDFEIMVSLFDAGADREDIVHIYNAYPVQNLRAARRGGGDYVERTVAAAERQWREAIEQNSRAARMLAGGEFILRADGKIVMDRERLRKLILRQMGVAPLELLPPSLRGDPLSN